MSRRRCFTAILAALLCLMVVQPAAGDNLTLTMTPVPLTDGVVTNLFIDFFGGSPDAFLPSSLTGIVAGGGGYSNDGDVVAYLYNYINLFPPFALLLGMAESSGANGQFAAAWFAKSPIEALSNFNLDGLIKWDWQWSNVNLLQADPTNYPPELLTTLMSPSLGLAVSTTASVENYLFSYMPVLNSLPSTSNVWTLTLLAGETDTDYYWLFAIIAENLDAFASFPTFTDDQFVALVSVDSGTGSFGMTNVPLPGAFWLFSTGLLGLGAMGFRRRRK